ncbi:MAG: putative DNA-binding protein (MmcQ/YjbR family) [Sphingobacteriales bacterium]
MNIEEYREYCLAKHGATEGLPFGPTVLVFKVMNKMFALTDLDKFESINLKCDPERAIALRESNPGIIPGYHMSKKLWNTLSTQGEVDDKLLYELIDHSYDLVVDSLTKKMKNELEEIKKLDA